MSLLFGKTNYWVNLRIIFLNTKECFKFLESYHSKYCLTFLKQLALILFLI